MRGIARNPSPAYRGMGLFFHLPSGHRSLRSQSSHWAPVNRTRFRRYSQSPCGETLLELRHASTTPLYSVQSRIAIGRHIYWRSRASPGLSRPANLPDRCLPAARPGSARQRYHLRPSNRRVPCHQRDAVHHARRRDQLIEPVRREVKLCRNSRDLQRER